MKRTLSDIAIELNEQSGHRNMPPLIFITDQTAQPQPEDIINILPKNSMVILRDYDHENRHDLAKALRYVCRSKDIKFIVAGDLTLALMVDADGIHLPGHMIDEAAAIRADHPSYFITAACHGEDDLKKCEALNIDAALLAPIFPTESHPETIEDPDKTIGAEKLRGICEGHNLPIYALGGVNINTVSMLKQTGLAGIAAIRGID